MHEARRARERTDEIGRDIIERLCSEGYREEKRREKSMGFVAAVAAELYRVDSKLHGA